MIGLEQFLITFGDITVTKLVTIGIALFFIWKIYVQIKKFIENKKQLLINKYKSEEEKDAQLKKALEEVGKYPEYREQSRKIQQAFRNEIDELKKNQEELSNTQKEICDTLKEMQEVSNRRERNKLRDKLLQSYRYYTNENTNPDKSWTKMESEAFWELFRDYEDAGGDGYVHSVVQPAMNLLNVVDIGKK